MKKIMSAIMILLIASGIIFPLFTFAAAKKIIYNCGDDTSISYIEENGKKYIAVQSLVELDIDAEYFTDHICLSTKSKNVEIYIGSNTVYVGNTTLFYKNPIIEINACKYISLDLVAMLFSQDYEETDDAINLWITYAPINSAKGIIALPGSETAPEGGVKATIYAFQKRLTSYTTAVTPTIGYDGVYLFDDKPFAYKSVLLAEKEIVIEKGKHQAEFFLFSADKKFGNSCYIGYRIDNSGYFSEGATNFDYKEEQQYNFTLNKYSIQGTVEVSEAPAEDTNFRIKAVGNQSYEACGVIPKGETSCNYRISVPSDTYKVSIVFENKAYKAADYPESVKIYSKSADNISFSCVPSGKISVKLTLSEAAEEDIPLNVFLQSADAPYYYLDVQDAFIGVGDNAAYVELTNELGCDNLICYYELEQETDSLNGFGYYNEKGTDYNLSGAQKITDDSEISMELLKAKSTAKNLTLETWAENERAYVNIKNNSVFDRKNINVFMASYNGEKLAGLDMVTVTKLLKARDETIYFDIPNADTIKVFAWCEMKPFSKSVYLKKDGAYISRSAQIRLCAGSRTIYNYVEESIWDAAPIISNGVLLAPVRPFAEILNCDVSFDSETNTFVFTIGSDTLIVQSDNKKAFFNDKAFELSEPMCIIDDRTYLPAADIAEKFGYTSEFNMQTGELFLYIDETMHLVNRAKANGDLPKYLFSKDMTAPITRFDAAQILAVLCETITASELEYSDTPIYTDTDDINVLKVSKAGILSGVSDTMFSPDSFLTNAEFANALYNALVFSGETLNYNEYTEKFYDDGDIPLYAKIEVYSLKEYEAFENICDKIFSPDDVISFKRAIATAQNCITTAYYSLFSDISPDSPYLKAIIRLYRMGLTVGFEDGTYRPELLLTRAEACTLITKMQGGETVNDFSCKDVSESDWCQGYVGYCVKNNIMDLQDGKFFPYDCLTGIDALSAMLRISGYTDFTSEDEISEAASSIGLTDGIYKFDTSAPVSREKFAQLMYNTLKIQQRI